MKRIVVLLSAILLIFAVACSGDNPQPGDSSGSDSMITVNAPEINTQNASADDLERFAVIGYSIPEGIFTSPAFAPFFDLDGDIIADDIYHVGVGFAIAGSKEKLDIVMNGFDVDVENETGQETTKCTVWGTITTSDNWESTVLDLTIQINGEAKEIYTYYVSYRDEVCKVNDKAVTIQ